MLESEPPEIDLQLHPEALHRGVQLGEGSFGTVYKGQWDRKPVALKVLHARLLGKPDEVERFQQEMVNTYKVPRPCTKN